jgi:hypothetical protein
MMVAAVTEIPNSGTNRNGIKGISDPIRVATPVTSASPTAP